MNTVGFFFPKPQQKWDPSLLSANALTGLNFVKRIKVAKVESFLGHTSDVLGDAGIRVAVVTPQTVEPGTLL